MATVKDNGVGGGERELRRAVLLERSRRLGILRRPVSAMSPAAARSALDASEAAMRRNSARPAA